MVLEALVTNTESLQNIKMRKSKHLEQHFWSLKLNSKNTFTYKISPPNQGENHLRNHFCPPLVSKPLLRIIMQFFKKKPDRPNFENWCDDGCQNDWKADLADLFGGCLKAWLCLIFCSRLSFWLVLTINATFGDGPRDPRRNDTLFLLIQPSSSNSIKVKVKIIKIKNTAEVGMTGKLLGTHCDIMITKKAK